MKASLNHVYRVIWNALRQAWTVVSETAKSAGKTASLSTTGGINALITSFSMLLNARSQRQWLIATAFSVVAMPSFALPTGAENIYGSFDAVTQGNTLTITQHTQKSIVNWQAFGVASGEAVNLLQPTGGVALYRVLGNQASEIYGQLSATGQLFLINPNGVLFGESAQVNVGGLVASTLDIKNNDFINGNYRFNAGDVAGHVINRGTIKAKDEGYIVLLGEQVENAGTLVANQGSVVLASAKAAVLDFFGNGLVQARLTGEAVNALVKNSGLIQANGGVAQLATSARAAAINVSGIIEANQLVERDGMIRLEGGDHAQVQVSGRLLARGEDTTGGHIEVTGEQVALMPTAVLDASGQTGGGQILVGGDYQGRNAEVYNAKTTYVANGARLTADAIAEGDGGKVIVWADDLTRYYGAISARGGANVGNGGFAEVSGKQALTFAGKVDLSGINGVGGKLLLDPENIFLVATSQTSPPNNANGPDIAFLTNPGADTFVEVSDVVGVSELFLQANNNINVDAPLTMVNPFGNIRLEANNNINVNAALTAGVLGRISLIADADNVGGGNIQIGANITGRAGVSLSGATITQTAGNINATGNPFNGIAGGVVIATTGAANLGNANINANGITVAGANSGSGGDVIINANSLLMTGNINTAGANAAPTLAGQGGKVTINTQQQVSVGNIITSGGSAAENTIGSRLSGEVTVKSADSDVVIGNINANGGTNSFGATVILEAAGAISAGNISSSAGNANTGVGGIGAGNVTLTAGSGIQVGSIQASGANGNGANTSGGAAGAIGLTSTTGDVSFGALTNTNGTANGSGLAGPIAQVGVNAGRDVIQQGNIQTSNTGNEAVVLVAGRNYNNTGDFGITVGSNNTTGATGRWLIYSTTPLDDVRGTAIDNAFNFKQYGFTGTLPNGAVGNGLIYTVNAQINPVLDTSNVTPQLSGIATKVYDGNVTVTDISQLIVNANTPFNDTIVLSPITTAEYVDKNVGTGITVTTNDLSIISASSNGRAVFGYTLANTKASGNVGVITPAPISAVTGITANDKLFDGNTLATLNTGNVGFSGIVSGDQLTVATAVGAFVDSAIGVGKLVNISGINLGGIDAGNYALVSSTATTTASILPLSSPRDSSGLGGLVGNNPVLNSMTIVSLNPAAGDEEDLDAVACPTNDDKFGSTPILNSGVKLPNGVTSNCI